MKILILGGAGYLGWPSALYLAARDHEVGIVDNIVKEKWEKIAGVKPLEPYVLMVNRMKAWDERGRWLHGMSHIGIDISAEPGLLSKNLRLLKPEVIIHYAEQPSAPYSMMNDSACYETQRNNILGTLNLILAVRECCPDAHIVKLGTMGEYGVPNIDIEEGWLDVEYKGRKDNVLFPKRPGSFYHLSKVHDSHNLEFACRTWGLRVTDLNQGIVYGTGTVETDLHPNLRTSFHYDHIFGTVLNRFVTEAALELPLTVYGSGNQRRCFISILDVMKCIELVCLNPPAPGEFRVFNQFTEVISLKRLAVLVSGVAKGMGLTGSVANLENPRVESEDHYYNPSNSSLLGMGLEPHELSSDRIEQMIHFVYKRRELVNTSTLNPRVGWR